MGTLTDRTIKTAKARETRYELSDGEGLFLAVEPNGKKIFHTFHQIKGKRQRTTIGAHPLFSPREAGESNDVIRQRIYKNEDPWAPESGKATLTEVASHDPPGCYAYQSDANQAVGLKL